MTLDTTRHDPGAEIEYRPGPEDTVPIAPSGAWRDAPEHVLSGTVMAGQQPYPPAFAGAHPAYGPLPLHVLALLDHRDLPAPHPQAIEIMRRYHLWPAFTSCGYSALGWWANLEPNHIWLMLPFLGLGIFGPVAGWLGHLAHGDDADKHLTRGLIVGGAIGMSGAAAVGAGFSGISAMMTAVLAVIGTLGSVDWRRHRRQADRDFIVDYTAAAASAPMPPAPVGAPLPEQSQHGVMSDEAHRLFGAFAALGVTPIRVDAVRRVGPDAWLTYVYTPESKSLSARWLAARLDTLRNNMRCRSIQIIPTAIGSRYEVRVQDGEASPHDEVHLSPGPNTDDVTVPIDIGLDEAGAPISFKLKGRHTLYSGITDGGKSVGVNVAACSVAAMKNAVMVLLDLKPGQLELGPYERVAYRSAAGIKDAELLLQALCAAMEERGQILKEERDATGTPVREWDPNNPSHGPAIVAIIDELAEMLRLSPKLFELWLRIMQVGRALGIYLIGATQSPSSKALGGTTDGSGQFTNVACYRAKSATQTNVILGPGAHGEGWRADETTLPLAGMFLPRSPEYPRPTVGRGFLITPEQVMTIVAEYESQRPELDERTAAAMEQVLDGRCDPTNPQPPGGQSPDSVDTANDFHADVRHLFVVPAYPDDSVVEPKHRDAWAKFRTMGSATVLEFKAQGLSGLTSRESAMGVLKVFKVHGGATSMTDTDGRSERFVCAVPVPQRRDA